MTEKERKEAKESGQIRRQDIDGTLILTADMTKVQINGICHVFYFKFLFVTVWQLCLK